MIAHNNNNNKAKYYLNSSIQFTLSVLLYSIFNGRHRSS